MRDSVFVDRFGYPVRIIEIGLLLFLTVFFELTERYLLPNLPRPGWALVFAIYLGWYSPPLRGGITGCLFGLLEDYLVGIYLGVNGISKTLAGFWAHYLNRTIAAESRFLRFSFIVIIAILDRSAVWLMFALIGHPMGAFPWMATMGHALLTGLVGEMVFWVFDHLRAEPKDFRRL